MTFDPLLDAPLHIQLHTAAATLALVLGPMAILRPRRDRLHKSLGYVWVAAMAFTALSSFAIGNFGVIGPVSPIHLLAVLVLWSLWRAMRAILAGNVRLHRVIMQNLYWKGLLIAGLFNFLPGRTLSRALLPDTPEAGWAVIGAGLALIFAPELRRIGLFRPLRRLSGSAPIAAEGSTDR
ncbi:DUF2306 domain-containing protein [Anianabacter salinae]|uniref:DUF2306 domain-containing protein n=1 Tax=Anianabacter salinae TaxID=2851023 RepID=UPI00225E62D3|nr:DUF2306 domain-containing protein [Anianabacter salinae]MBV0914000.1 DUF2306 domain-containing protein [Anianabacter salinae]